MSKAFSWAHHPCLEPAWAGSHLQCWPLYGSEDDDRREKYLDARGHNTYVARCHCNYERNYNISRHRAHAFQVTTRSQFHHYLSKSSKHHGHDANCAIFFHIFQPLKKATARNVTHIGSLHVAPNYSESLRVKKRPDMLLTLVLRICTKPSRITALCHLLGIRFLPMVGQNQNTTRASMNWV